MKRSGIFAAAAVWVLALAAIGSAQEADRFTGTVLSYGSGFNTRVVTSNFDLEIRAYTPQTRAKELLSLLQEGNQNELLDELRKDDLGMFSVGPRVGRTINAAFESEVDGKRRIFIVFERWTQFAELRGSYRSLDYPFGVIEIFVDPKTGKGEGTYIAAAKIRWRERDGSKDQQIEIEGFATFPAKLMGVKQVEKRAP